MIAGPRLIHRTEVLGQLLAAVAAVPAGVKLGIPQLRDALVSQADVLDGLQALVAANELDRQTLRPPVKAEAPGCPPIPAKCGTRRRGQSADGVPARPLFDALVAEGKRRGLSVEATSLGAFANKARIYSLLKRDTVRAKTAAKIRAWIADAPVEAAETPKDPIAPRASPFDLHRDIQAFLTDRGISTTAFGRAVNGDGSLVKAIRAGRVPHAKTVTKIRAILANPPAELLNVRYRESRIRPTPSARRDPTQPPETPLMDLADRQRMKGQRHSAAINRAREKTATDLVDAGAEPSKQSSYVAAQMREISRRRADEARQADPVEQAKLALQRKGRTVYCATVIGGKKGHFVVSGMGKEVTPAALIAEAERATGQSFRRSAA